MTIQNNEKLNRLMQIVPEGVAVPMAWLSERGYSRQLVATYMKGGWLEGLGHGVYMKPKSGMTWQGAVLGFQYLLGTPCHVGGITALNNQGLGHYLPIESTSEGVHLWGKKPPAWLGKLKSVGEFEHHGGVLFEEDNRSLSDQCGVEAIPAVRDWKLYMSSPERAILEVLSIVGESEEDFMAAADVFSGLTSLRPKMLNKLLLQCKSIKAKRLLLCMAEENKMQWLDKIEISKVDVGKGKRQIVKGGRYDKKHLITVPKQFGRAFSSAFGKGFS